MSRSLALLGLSLLLGLGLGCDKKKGPSEEPTSDSGAGAGEGVVVEEPGDEPAEGAVDPIADKDELKYEGTVEVVGSSVPCNTDADCVPQECCHPTSCGAPSGRPDCSATMCTTDCRTGTMDCFGGCACGEDKMCAATIWTTSPS